MLPIESWLPTTQKELKKRNWNELDVIFFSGDAYIDHPAFGTAVIARVLENKGLRIAIVPQPNWQDDLRDFKKFGKPKLFFAVTSGNMDSMVNHYTANKRLRSNDAYTPDGKAGFRPDYATTVYSQILKKFYPDTPLIIGGIEASLRRLTHYDYWQDSLKKSILIDSQADMLVYGNGEKAITKIAELMQKGVPILNIKNVEQTAFIVNSDYNKFSEDAIKINSHDQCLKDKKSFASNFKVIEQQSNKMYAKQILQQVDDKTVVVNPPFPKTSEKELDAVYDLPFTRLPHPKYKKRGAIPAFEMIKNSVNIHRGCFGSCSFCTISAHQGKFIVSRSEKSILKEIRQIANSETFNGTITDLGGPSANMYRMKGKDLSICEKCVRPSCINPSICKNLNTDHSHLTKIYQKALKIEGVKKVFIGSGIRYDMLFDRNQEMKGDKLKYTQQLVKHHVSGRLKIAPEHTSDKVLKTMRKPSFKLFYKFKSVFDRINKQNGLNQQLVPYFISSHPNSSDIDMAMLAVETKSLNFRLEQVQDFTPTPMTVSSVIFYSGYHPYTLEKISTPKTKQEKQRQNKYFFWYKKEHKNDIRNSLKKLKRNELATKLLGR